MKKIYMSLLHILISYLLIYVNCQVSVLGPPELVSKLKNYEIGASGNIQHALGNFGEIPYGRTVVGYVFLQTNTDGKNTWCDFETTITPVDLDKDPDNEYSPIFLVDYSDDCPLTRKAYNVRARGARVMLLVSDDDTYKNHDNVDDQLGDRIDIPTVIIRKNEGEEIKKYMSTRGSEKVVMSIKFMATKDGGPLKMELFMKSDDLKALHFFKEFRQYYEKLKDKINFVPYYKYYSYKGFDISSDSITTVKNHAECFKKKFCSHDNSNMRIMNPRIVLLENLRQQCVYETYKVENLDLYWNYMINFAETCADPINPLFTEECAIDMLKYTGVDTEKIKNCMETQIKDDNGIVESSFDAFKTKNVHKVPELLLNDIKYRGSWLGKYFFESICSGFIEDYSICSSPKPGDIGYSGSGLSTGTLLLIIFIIFIFMIILLICYRRIVNKSLEASLNEKIQTQTIHSLSQYQVFKDEGTGKKSFDLNNL